MNQEILVTGGPLTEVKIGAAGIRSVVQNVRTILATIVGELFLDRDFGVSADMVDKPALAAMQHLRAEVAAKVERFEPRVKVLRVDFIDPGLGQAIDGKLVPKVLIRIRDGALL